jgi:hypothetical protein
MLRFVGTLTLAFFACAPPSTKAPGNETEQLVVEQAVELGERCSEIDDLTSLAWSWSQLCWHRSAPELARAQAALESCRAASVERGLTAAGVIPEGINLNASLELDGNCPADPPNDIAQLQVYSELDYGVEDGAAIQIVLTNFCDQEIEYGFSPDLESKPPIKMRLPALTRRTLTIPRNYGLRGRVDYDEDWPPITCTAARSGTHLTFNADCRTCTSGGSDPLLRADCVEAGSCPPPGSR